MIFNYAHKMRIMDDIDRKLLRLLQGDSNQSNQELGQALTLSGSQVGRRRQQLEEAGFIDRYAAQLNPAALGLNVQAFVQVSLQSQERGEAENFLRLCEGTDEIVSIWRLTGEADYLLRVYCSDLERFNTLLRGRLLSQKIVARVHSQIVLEHVKRDTPLPL